MPYRLDIPGQVSVYQLRAIELVASLVPAGGAMVEVGSLFGRSSWAWGASVDPSVQVFCLDPWDTNAGVWQLELRHGVKYGLEQFVALTRDRPNIRPRAGYSPDSFLDWDLPIDLYYEDAVHTDPVLTRNLDFWTSKLKPNGIVCGDDYRPRFPDVREGAARLARRLGRALVVAENFWCLLPPESEVPKARDVAREIEAIHEEAMTSRRQQGPLISIGPKRRIPTVPESTRPAVNIQVANESLDPWLVHPSDGHSPAVSVSIFQAEQPTLSVAEELVPINVAMLAPDIPVNLDVHLPCDQLDPGTYRAVFGLLDADGRRVEVVSPETRDGVAFTIEAARTTRPQADGTAQGTAPAPQERNAASLD